MDNLYNKIETLCQASKINITTMCNESGASRGSLTDLKQGRKQSLSADTLTKIASYFNVSIDYLLGNEQKPAPKNGDELVADEFIAFYGETKKHLTKSDIDDLKSLMRLRSELNRDNK